MKNEAIINPDLVRSYGRVNGRKLRPMQQELLDNLLPKLAVDIDGEFPKPLHLEIGFGYGEHLFGLAQKYPDVNFIGCEPFVNGVATLLKYINESDVSNINILHGDARLLIDKLPESSVERVFILFPDPWPKAKHHKKRIICEENLKALARIMPKGARLDIATDHVEYGEWIAEKLADSTYFAENKSVGAFAQPADWVETRYQQKARAEGREARFFNYVKC